MDSMLLPVMIAAAVGLAIWGVTRMFTDTAGGEKKRLNQRLSNESGTSTGPVETRSITLQLDVVGVPEFLARLSVVQALNRRLLLAYPRVPLGRFLLIAAGAGFGAFSLTLLLSASPFMALGAGVVALYVPFFLLNSKRSKRQRMMNQQLPEALDFLSRVLKAGHSFSTGLQMMSEELPQPLSNEFRRCYDQHSLGQALEDSLKETAARIESTDFGFFVTALLIQRQTGGDLSEVLKNISNMIRGRIRLAQQVKAKTAEGRFTGYILVAFPALMFALCYTQNPEYCGKLLRGTGLYFLGTAFTLQMLGLWTIRKITTVRV